jgi:hypothetical protein
MALAVSERDMIAVRVSGPQRIVVVGSPASRSAWQAENAG